MNTKDSLLGSIWQSHSKLFATNLSSGVITPSRSLPPILVTFFLDHSKIRKIALSSAQNFSWEIQGEKNRGVENQIHTWLESYVNGKTPLCALPIEFPELSSFSRKVLSRLALIPFGQTISYGLLAEQVGHPGAARGVGTACKLNPFPFIIPCHRVIQSNGSPGGYAYGVQMKNSLLNFEQNSLKH